MKKIKRNLVGSITGIVLSGIFALLPLSGVSGENNCVKHNHIQSHVAIEQEQKKSEQLYRTKTGKCYHKNNCRYLNKSKIKVTHEEIQEADLHPCSKCCK